MRMLGQADRQAILDLAYARERENLFLIGNFENPKAFEENRYVGAFEDGQLRSVVAWFGTWGTLLATGSLEHVPALAELLLLQRIRPEAVSAFEPYGSLLLDALRQGGYMPRSIEPSLVMEVSRAAFLPVRSVAEPALESDREGLAILQRSFRGRDESAPLTDAERKRANPVSTFVLREEGRVVSQACFRVRSTHFALIGGIVTHTAHRRQGYARQCVSALCAHLWTQGVESILLFTAEENREAQGLYTSLGFRLTGEKYLQAYF